MQNCVILLEHLWCLPGSQPPFGHYCVQTVLIMHLLLWILGSCLQSLVGEDWALLCLKGMNLTTLCLPLEYAFRSLGLPKGYQ